MFGRRGSLAVGLALCFLGAPAARAATLNWKGHTWQVTSGGMAGVCQGDPNNVSVDASGYLHLKISHNGSVWSSAELFTTDRIGFGTYQWQVDGPIDTFDRNVVLGLFPYGPAAQIGADGTNEIDIEYSRWGQANGPNGDWTNYPASGTGPPGELSYTFSLAGATLSTSRFVWSSTSIVDFLFSGLQPIDGTAGLIKTWTYAPQNPTVNIPQQALPLGMNLWCYSAPPSDGNPVEIVIRDFAFAAPGTTSGTGGSGGAAGGGAGGSSGGASGAGGRGGGVAGSGGAGGGGGSARGGSGGGAGGGGRGGAAGGTTGGGGNAGSSGGAAGGSSGGGGGTGGAAGSGGRGGAGGGPAGGTGGGGNAGSSGGPAGAAGGSSGGGPAMGGRGGGAAGAGGASSGQAGGPAGGGGGDGGCNCGITPASGGRAGAPAWVLLAWLVAIRRSRRRADAARGT